MEPNTYIQESKAVRKAFCLTGIAVSVFFILFQLVGVFFSQIPLELNKSTNAILNSTWFQGVGIYLVVYLIAFPPFYFIMRYVPQSEPKQKEQISKKEFWMWFVITMGAGYLLNLVGTVINLIISLMNQGDFETLNPINDLFSNLNLFIILYATVLGPIMEEVVFRGIIINHTRQYGEKTAIVFSAVLFGLFHGNIAQTLYATAIGLIFGYLTVKTGSIRQSVIMHIMTNAISVLYSVILVKNMEEMSLGATLLLSMGLWILILGFIAFGILFLCMMKKTIALSPDTTGLTSGRKWRLVYLNVGMVIYYVLVLSAMFHYIGFS